MSKTSERFQAIGEVFGLEPEKVLWLMPDGTGGGRACDPDPEVIERVRREVAREAVRVRKLMGERA
jgi:hypothetical protein